MKLEEMTTEQITAMDPIELAALITVDNEQQEYATACVVESLEFDFGHWDKIDKSFEFCDLQEEHSAPWAVKVWQMLPDEKRCYLMEDIQRKAEEDHRTDVGF